VKQITLNMRSISDIIFLRMSNLRNSIFLLSDIELLELRKKVWQKYWFQASGDSILSLEYSVTDASQWFNGDVGIRYPIPTLPSKGIGSVSGSNRVKSSVTSAVFGRYDSMVRMESGSRCLNDLMVRLDLGTIVLV